MTTSRKLSHLLSKSLVKLKQAAPTLLTVASIGGMVATVITAVNATPKAHSYLDKAAMKKNHAEDTDLSLLEKAKATVPCYIPTIVLGSATAACMVGANVLGRKQYLGALSASIAVDQMYKEYREKLRAMLGKDTEAEIRKEIMRDDYPGERPDGTDEFPLFYDPWARRYFNKSMEDVIDAAYHFNRNFILRGYATLNEYYDFLGLEQTDFGDSIGWSEEVGYAIYGYQWIDIEYMWTVLDDGLECYYINFPFEPTADFLDLDSAPRNLQSIL